MRQFIAQVAEYRGMTAVQLIVEAVRRQHFSNEAEVIAQNISRYSRPGLGLPDYIVDYAQELGKGVRISA